MKIELFQNPAAYFPWGLVLLWGLIWLGVLHRILTRGDFDSPTKILWVLVVILVPVFGVILDAVAAPSPDLTRDSGTAEAIAKGSDVAGTPWAKNPGFTQDK